MNVVDSSAWLEYFADGPNTEHFARPIQAVRKLVVPTICVLEVFKRVLVQRGEDLALQAVALMRQGGVVDLDFRIALSAAKLSTAHKIPMADCVVLATARTHNALLWTQDADFEGLEGVKYFAKE